MTKSVVCSTCQLQFNVEGSAGTSNEEREFGVCCPYSECFAANYVYGPSAGSFRPIPVDRRAEGSGGG